MYGIDCPELAKKKSDPQSSQPFAQEAKDYTSRYTLDKTVELKLFKKDQYGRAISKVKNYDGSANNNGGSGSVPATTTTNNDLSANLISNGLAIMYTGKGAVYDSDSNKEFLKILQEQAKTHKLGMWSLGDDEFLTPSEFKRLQKQQKQARHLIRGARRKAPTKLLDDDEDHKAMHMQCDRRTD